MARSTVLIVEDEERLRRSLGTIVRGCGFDVFAVADGEEAVSALGTAAIDIVLTDLLMPRRDGYGLIRWMHARGMPQPVVVISGHSTFERIIEALRLGAYDYITKPFEFEDVEASLRRAETAVERRRTDAALRRRNRELAALNTISAAVNSSLDLDELLDRTLGATVEALEIAGALLYLGDTERGMELYRCYGSVPARPSLAPERLAAPASHAVAIGETQVAEVIALAAAASARGATRLKAALPLLAGGAPCGLLLLAGSAAHELQHEQRSLLEAIANYIGVALGNARLYRQVRDSALNLERLVEQRTRELRQSRDLLRTIFDGIPSGLLLAAADGQVLTANRAYIRLAGYAHELAPGTSYGELCDDQSAAEVFARCVDTGQPVSHREQQERAGQPPAFLDRYLFPVHDDTGQVVQIIEYLEDVTERLAMERVLAQTEQLAALGKLAATVAHEVNTPLLAIRGCLGLIASPRSASADRAEYLRMAESELDRAAGIIRAMLDFYRTDGSEPVSTDINALVMKAVQVLRPKCDQHSVAIDLQLAAQLPAISAVPDQLKQVLLNVLLNAIEAIGSDGLIIVRTSLQSRAELDRAIQGVPALGTGHASQAGGPPEAAEMVAIAIEDSGPGIIAAIAHRIFDAFVTTKGAGSGLGLAVSQTILQEHGGIILAANRPGGGARFVIALQVAANHQEENV